MTGPGLEAIFKACTSLTHLDLTDAERMPDRVFASLAEHCHHLKALHFRNCRKLTNESLNAIVSSSTSLTKLHIGGCVKIREKVGEAVVVSCVLSSRDTTGSRSRACPHIYTATNTPTNTHPRECSYTLHPWQRQPLINCGLRSIC